MIKKINKTGPPIASDYRSLLSWFGALAKYSGNNVNTIKTRYWKLGKRSVEELLKPANKSWFKEVEAVPPGYCTIEQAWEIMPCGLTLEQYRRAVVASKYKLNPLKHGCFFQGKIHIEPNYFANFFSWKTEQQLKAFFGYGMTAYAALCIKYFCKGIREGKNVKKFYIPCLKTSRDKQFLKVKIESILLHQIHSL